MADTVVFRVWIGGMLADEQHVATSTFSNLIGDAVADVAAAQADICAAAYDVGIPYMVEVVFPDDDHVRFGTDEAGMVEPRAVAMARLAEKIAERWPV